MSAVMENKNKDYRTEIDKELMQLKVQIGEKILADQIDSEEDLNTLVKEQSQMIVNRTTTGIQSISDNELNDYFKNQLIDELRKQVEKASQDLHTDLCNEYLKYQFNIKKENCGYEKSENQSRDLRP